MNAETRCPDFTRRLDKLMVGLALVLSLVLATAVWAEDRNPAAEGFNAKGSDARAIALADKVMEAMGGRTAWDSTRYISWNFFGRRTHLWDKWTGDLRFEQGDRLVLMNVNTKKGQVYDKGAQIADSAEIDKAMKAGYEAWINDSYWLIMPYKLKDSGVTLRYVGEQAMEDGRMADVVQLTFEDVGVTPDNKYHVFIGKDSSMVEQWAFFKQASDEKASIVTPWGDWKTHGKVKLSGDRGRFSLPDIAVYTDVPRSAFESSAALDTSAFK